MLNIDNYMCMPTLRHIIKHNTYVYGRTKMTKYLKKCVGCKFYLV